MPGSKMSIPFEATLGDVKVYYQRSAKYGLGQADCWVDNDGKSGTGRSLNPGTDAETLLL